MDDETTQAETATRDAVQMTAQHDMPVAMTVGASGRLVVATAAGRLWEWDGKAKTFRAFAVLPGSQAEDEVRSYRAWRAQQEAEQARQMAQQPSEAEVAPEPAEGDA